MSALTHDDAWSFIDLIHQRLVGWSIALCIVDGRMDLRRRQAREASEVLRDIYLNIPKSDVLVDALVRGEDIVSLWPESLQATVRFQLEHKVPRAQNEPTAQADQPGRDRLSPLFADHGAIATVADHPPLPSRSVLYLAWEKTAKVYRRRSKLRVIHGGRE